MPYIAQQQHGRRSRTRAIADPRHDALDALLAAVTRAIDDVVLPTPGPFADSPWIRTVPPKPEYL
jgi:hypothetical protein